MTDAERIFAIAWGERQMAYLAVHRLGIDFDADDIVQCAMLDVWKLLLRDGFEPAAEGTNERTAVGRWVFGVARIAAFQYIARNKPLGDPPDDDAVLDDLDLEARAAAREELRLVLCRLNRVETALVTGTAQGETLEETGTRMRMPWGTVSTKLRAVRKVLRKRFPRER